MLRRQATAKSNGLERVLASLVLAGFVVIQPAHLIGAEGSERDGRPEPPRSLERPSADRALTPSRSAGASTAEATVPSAEGGEPRDPATRPGPAETLRADAGDDQIGLVGRRITLNGSRSEPRGQLGYRWMQLDGPRIMEMEQDRYILSFTPTSPGIYRFALLVAAHSAISEPATVEVTVGVPPSTPVSGFSRPPTSTATQPAPPPIDQLARSALAGLEGGPGVAEPLASTFEALADRMDLYQTYADLFSEMSRRLDAFVPREPARRALWIDRLFTPMTARLVEQLRTEGLDLTRPEGPSTPLSPAQKAKLTELFRAMSQGFQATLLPK